jgi:hypothetical protein
MCEKKLAILAILNIELSSTEKTTPRNQPPAFSDWLIAFEVLPKNKPEHKRRTAAV